MTIILFRGVAQPPVRSDKQRSAALDAGGFGEAYDFRKFGFQFQKWGTLGGVILLITCGNFHLTVRHPNF